MSNPLNVDPQLNALLEKEILPGTGLNKETVWVGFAEILQDLAPRNEALLARRDELQAQLDAWYQDKNGQWTLQEQKDFLTQIGYLVEDEEAFSIQVDNVDPELATIAGPQLVVPVDNPRYAINAANARWGSLYDALYGTDVIAEEGDAAITEGLNPVRAQRVVDYAMQFLDKHFPLETGSHGQTAGYRITGEVLAPALENPEQWVGFTGAKESPTSILLKNNNLHVELVIDRGHPVGKLHPAGIKDIILESAVSTIMDCEDSVAAVDASDKVNVYRNWLGVMRGDLSIEMKKGDKTFVRQLNPDREYTRPDGTVFTLPGRSLLFVRNVGMHMKTDAVTTAAGEPIPETFLDALFTSLAALHDLKRLGTLQNSRTGSIYIVKPKMHGPEEAALQVELFARIEKLIGLAPNTIKMGIMDEERRTSVNLKECIRAAKNRVVFINTGFLDRTGDEIHSLMHAGAVVPKPEIKNAPWLQAYEDANVNTGLACGLPGSAQIGKGMWAMTDLMADMTKIKIGHPKAGASTAWVPSPTAATLHAMHYHEVDVPQIQKGMMSHLENKVDAILSPALLGDRSLSEADIQKELRNNVQGILGYVVRWIDQGVGCSKVPDINNINLMEDRATLRISSQHIANWLQHGIITREQVLETMREMAAIVDRQNSGDPAYEPMAPDFDNNIAVQAAKALIFDGTSTPNGYTEFALTRFRRKKKAAKL